VTEEEADLGGIDDDAGQAHAFAAERSAQHFDTDARTLTASRLHEGRWLELGTWSDDDVVRIEPFDAVEIRLADLWG